jgi:tetratricopeptide (TPR) repeat protein
MGKDRPWKESFHASKWNTLYLPIAIFFLAFSIRLIYLIQINSSLPFFWAPILDELYHDTWAQQIASGEWGGTEPFFRAPLYVYLLALVYKVVGHNLFLARLFHVFVGSLSCVLILLIATKLFNRTIGILSSVTACFYAMLVFYDAHLLITTLIVFLDLALIALLIRAGEKPSPLNWLLSGAVLGLSAIARPNILIFLPFILIWMIFRFKNRLEGKAILIRWAVLFVGAVLMIAPVTLRNYFVGKDVVLIAWQGGFNFYLGNNPDATGYTPISPLTGGDLVGALGRATAVAEQEMKRELKPSEISAFWYKKGVDFILSQPLNWLKLLGKKITYFWKGYEISNPLNIYLHKEFSSVFNVLLGAGIIYLPFGLMGPFSILGLFITLKRWKEYLLLYLFILSYSASVIIFFVCARFRMPIIPFLLMFSSFFLWWLYDKIKSKQTTRILISLCALAILVVPLNTRLEHLAGDQRYADHYSLGTSYGNLGRWNEAMQEFKTSLIFRPNYAPSHHGLGIVYDRLGKTDLAIQEYRQAIRCDPSFELVYNDLGILYYKKGEVDRAIEFYLKAIRLNERYEAARINLGYAYLMKGLREEAREQWRKVLELNPGNDLAIDLLKRR